MRTKTKIIIAIYILISIAIVAFFGSWLFVDEPKPVSEQLTITEQKS